MSQQRQSYRPAGRPGGKQPRRGKPRLQIVYEDKHFLVVDKPTGMPTGHEPDTPRGRRTLMDLVLDMLHEQGSIRPRVWVTHRLDAETSGLVLFAKTTRAFDWLKEDRREQHVLRVYTALAEGAIDSHSGAQAGTIESPILDTGERLVEIVHEHSPPPRRPGKPRGRQQAQQTPRPAVTQYKVSHTGERYTLLRVRTHTDVRHQIRAHMASIGHPLAGDLRYGATSDPLGRLGLHLGEMRFVHPGTGERVHLTSPAPNAMWDTVGVAEPVDNAGDSEDSNDTPPPPPPLPSADAPRSPAGPEAASPTAWEEVAGWYDELVEDRRNDLHHEVVLPGAVELLEPEPGQRVLDLACGQGVLARHLVARGVRVWGVDASPGLIEAARARTTGEAAFALADATRLEMAPRTFWPDEPFDAVACVMALMNMEPLDAVLAGVASRLRVGGRFVAVLLHPAFRSPGRTAWGWDSSEGPVRQYRRVDAYLSEGEREIVMNPGKAAHGASPVVTKTYHRPLATYVRALAEHGLVVDRREEWASPRQSEPGPRAAEENRARREIPMFLGLRALRVAFEAPSGSGENG